MAKKILVIGAGPAGYPAALKARELGCEVTLAERAQVGGVCLNWGCIPSKSFLDAAHRFHTVSHLGGLLNDGSAPALEAVRAAMSWEKIQARRQGVIEKLKGSLKKYFDAKGVKLVNGTASFVSPNEVEIAGPDGNVRVQFDAAIIAAGTRPFFPKPFDAFREKLLDNDRVFSLPRLPKSVIVVGGGVIGAEFSCFFNALGSQVDIVEMLPGLIPGEDDAAVRALQSSFDKRGIKLHLGKTASGVAEEGGLKALTLSDGTVLRAEEILVAAGRVCELAPLKLENAGIAWDRKGVKVDSRLRTSVPHIFAAGDVNGLSLLAHAATMQGEIAAENAAGKDAECDNSLIPRCIYTWPEIASVGLNKKQAESAGRTVRQQRAFFMASGRAMTQDETEGFVQVVSDAATGEILGAQIAGVSATEMIHIFSVAIKAKMTVSDLKGVVFAHPTMSETIHEALLR